MGHDLCLSAGVAFLFSEISVLGRPIKTAGLPIHRKNEREGAPRSGEQDGDDRSSDGRGSVYALKRQ